MADKLLEQNKHNFKYHKPDSLKDIYHEKIRNAGKDLADMVAAYCLNNRERALAITKIEEAVMWANASIAREVNTYGR